MQERDVTDIELVVAARDGDPRAVDRLVAVYLPLVYNVVGRALDGHADVDDVVQETMLRCLAGLGELRSPESFRSWLVAIAVHQVRDRYRARRLPPPVVEPDEVADPGADFADLTILRLHLSGQRREVTVATRWLDADNRELLSLWWLETTGALTRDEVAHALGLTRQHTAVRVQRMKAQLDAARTVVRALDAVPRCPELVLQTSGWSGRPDPLWRKRLARHTRECVRCAAGWSDLVAAERLLAGLGLVPLPVPPYAPTSVVATTPTAGPTEQSGRLESAGSTEQAGRVVRTSQGERPPAWTGRAAGVVKPLTVGVAAALVVVVAAVAGYVLLPDNPGPAAPAGAAVVPSPSTTPTRAAATLTPTPTVAASASAAPTRSVNPAPTRSAGSAPAAPPAARYSAKKGVASWEFSKVKQGLGAVEAAWYYNWSASNATMPAPAGVEFVPMIWGAESVTDANLAAARRAGDVLLGFNEPDLGEQADMTVERALDLWPRLQATRLRLGSPAPAFGAADPGGWLDRFMVGAERRGHRVDFIALHWYGSDFSAAAVGHLRSYLEATHRRYGKPIWLTEFALINFSGGAKYPTDAQQAAFVTGAARMLEDLPYVQRYAWFGLPATADSGTGLYRADGQLTAAGRAYRAAG
ncbi:RNA polymerase sigma factor, sigma-70 family [Micromonospora phaseoli]|uniref:RNA polymerase sigma factor, sigma-70 family n=1 Tax=Micromonospora phaseoli TaxID=1144548 RepID=A0A1H7C0V1_9ACTN|nr:sigma-70 family RNA polymerase sigma factor [Micromonospora phaseoli]PZV92708.1 RNA polymerase sigma factor (sigma-70 family) [Micromonospora phaseoli]GIJ76638.1 hypothetical protein Xph01_10700 [Micromonospora phaseoli]SEJ83086.1 RNA polymerase sigma factor, sigma-70 family [Micromonospora phaseoli]